MSDLFSFVSLLLADRKRLMLENLALRHQLTVLKRSVNRPRIQDSDRVFWILMMRMLKEWKDALHFVKPATVLKWHRKGFRYYWRRKSKGKPGRPPISMKLILLIQRMSRENVTWGAPRIHDELVLLGHEVAESTIAKYMVKSRDPEPSQTWKTFVHNHLDQMAACDFFVVPTATFKVLYCFVVLELGRRQILHINVTEHPTDEWVARQVREAFPGSEEPRYLIRDNDSCYEGEEFEQSIKVMGIRQVVTAPRSPWQNGYAERVIGSIRRECTDHIIAFGQRHLLRILCEYVDYYNESRTHQSLDGNAPIPRWTERCGGIESRDVLGGLHHSYSRAA